MKAGAHMPEEQPPEQNISFEDLAEEFLQRLRNGETPNIDEYVRSYPSLSEEIREFFPAMSALETMKAQSVPIASREAGPLHQAGRGRARLGEYRIIREIGRGGMGVVYEAEQESLKRRVALKVLPVLAHMDERFLKRFKREAHLAAALEHPGIVPVFGIGEQDGLNFYVMQYIRGVGWDRLIAHIAKSGTDQPEGEAATGFVPYSPVSIDSGFFKDIVNGLISTQAVGGGGRPEADTNDLPEEDEYRIEGDFFSGGGLTLKYTKEVCSRLDPNYYKKAAALGAQAAAALYYAHSKGTLHRDIKPANLLLDVRGGVWITDFGLAKVLRPDGLTVTGEIKGSIRYMAPERFEGVDNIQGDIYGLGLTLYEMMTLRAAFLEEGGSGILKRIIENRLPAPRTLNPHIPPGLEAIIMKSVARDPAHRFSTAGEMADLLERFAKGDDIVQAGYVPSGQAEAGANDTGKVVRPWTVALVILLVLVLAAYAVITYTGKNGPFPGVVPEKVQAKSTAPKPSTPEPSAPAPTALVAPVAPVVPEPAKAVSVPPAVDDQEATAASGENVDESKVAPAGSKVESVSEPLIQNVPTPPVAARTVKRPAVRLPTRLPPETYTQPGGGQQSPGSTTSRGFVPYPLPPQGRPPQGGPQGGSPPGGLQGGPPEGQRPPPSRSGSPQPNDRPPFRPNR